MIQLKNVSKYYYSKGMIASGISKVNLEFNKGEFVVITGESGSGKTTLLNVISGLDSYEDGEMYINGRETSHFLASDFEEYRKKYIGYIFQSFNLVNSYTVYQNIELILLVNGYKKDEIKNRVASIIERVGLTKYTKTKVSKLSGGQKQRVSIARALAKDTDIIVADEPTGNLDSVSAEGIVELLSEISKDKLVIVVTHNYDQFEAYATRKIKMHDGKVVEDEFVAAENSVHEAAETGISAEARNSVSGDMRGSSKVKLGVRNTFNIIPKFILLLIVFLFVVVGVTSEYTSFQHSEAEADKLGYNEFFYNYSYDRVLLKKSDNSQFTDDDLRAIKSTENVKSVAVNDIMLDTALAMEGDGDFSYEAVPRSIGEFEGKLVAGRMPEAENEAVLAGSEYDYFMEDEMMDEVLGKEVDVLVGEDEEVKITIVGISQKKEDLYSYMYGGELYLADSYMGRLLKDTYNYNSKVITTINGKEQQYSEGSPMYRIVPSSKVAQGKAVASEEINNFFEKGDAKGKTINVRAENIYYTEAVNLQIDSLYNKKTFEAKTGATGFDDNNGTIYVNQADYDQLFAKGNYQMTAYIDNTREIDETVKALEGMGYTKLSLKDTLVSYGSEFTSIVQVPMAVIIVLALFFIAYFVIRLILKSRAGYFSILRMLGLAKRNIRRIMDVELFIVINIAYAIFIALIILVNYDVISIEYIRTLVEYMKITDYIILYVVLALMAYLISGKFVRSLFKKTAMGSYREED